MAEDPKAGNPRRERKPENVTGADLKSKISYLPDIHRLLPQSPEAEQGVLSSFLLAPKEVGAMCAEKLIKPAHFHIPAHGEVYGVLIELWDKGTPIDFITIAQILRDRNKLDAVGGAPFISSLFTFLPTAANAAYYLEIVQEKYVLREIIRVCTEYAARSYDEQDEVPMLLDKVEQEIFEIAKDRFKDKAASMKDMVMKAIGDIQQLYERRGKITGLETGFKVFDQMTDGLHGAEMIIVAARPSMGKTAFAMNLAEHIAVNLGKPVLPGSRKPWKHPQRFPERARLPRDHRSGGETRGGKDVHR
jgi:replicative DNA helicase